MPYRVAFFNPHFLPYWHHKVHELFLPFLTTQHNHKESVSSTVTMVSFLHRMETRRLTNVDMKRLVRILRDVPTRGEERYERQEALYRKHTKQDIQELPRRLRSSQLFFSSSGNLCSLHKGLNVHLINDIWAWLKHEFEGAIGKFLYPLIMSGHLTTEQEWKIRQLEPVLEMWRKDFILEACPPPGREPIHCGSKWHYQKDQCPACIMARIGSDEDVLSALFAGLVGRIHTKHLSTVDTPRSAIGWDKTSSKRLRFVRYWLKKTRGGDATLFEAGDLGMLLKRVRLQWKQEQRLQFYSLSGTTAQYTTTTSTSSRIVGHSVATSKSSSQDSRPHLCNSGTSKAYGTNPIPLASLPDPKVGPNPRPTSEIPLTPAEPLGFDLSHMRSRTFTVPQNQQDIHPALRLSNASQTQGNTNHLSMGTLKPSDSISVVASAPLPFLIPRKPVPPRKASSTHSTIQAPKPNIREDSFISPSAITYPPSLSLAETGTILSYTGGSSARANYTDPLDNPIYNPIETQEAGIEKYRRLLAADPESDPFAVDDEEEEDAVGDGEESVVFRAGLVPRPSRKSMYGAYGDGGFDGKRFDGVDEEVRVEEREEWEKDGMGGGEDVEEDGDEDEEVMEGGKNGCSVVDTPFTLSGTSPSLLRAHASETYPMPTLPTIPQISPVCNHPATLTRAPVNLTLAPTTPQNYNPHIPDIL
ncbi:hypothetical protein DDE83_002106 [Stemphylium lycopersici]|uniref:Uncharacterized protein n=1 Tax=Stemphylium lycopersici TaxID=183478 RepID=A0A364NBI5_STELY|nr:hypothetical protein DDE83_002106 [Stemphylium lycopersici]